MIDAFLEAHPHLKRDPDDLKELDARDKLPEENLRSRKRRQMDDDEDEDEDEDDEEEDDDDDEEEEEDEALTLSEVALGHAPGL